MRMMWADWMILAFIAILLIIGFKFPDPGRNWPFNVKATVKLFGFLLAVTVFFILANVVKNRLNWPPGEVVLFYFLLICFFILLVLGIFLPKGIKLKRD